MSGSAMTSGRSAGEVELNIVPLVDLCCLLILFFILTSQISSASLADLKVPDVNASQAKKISDEDNAKRVIINVVCKVPPGAANDKNITPEKLAEFINDSKDAKEYQVGGKAYQLDQVDKLVPVIQQEIKSAKQIGAIKKDDEFSVEIRGDARVMANYMEPVLRAAAQAGVSKVSLTALEGKQK